jgi:hypothetical protein
LETSRALSAARLGRIQPAAMKPEQTRDAVSRFR